MSVLIQCLVSGIMIGTVYTLVAVGFVLIYKSSGVLNFAQGELLLLGAYVCWSSIVQFHIPIWASFLIVIIYGLVLGLLIERLILRPLIGQSLIVIIMMTIGLSFILRGIVLLIWGSKTQAFPRELFPGEDLQIGGLSLPPQQVWSFAIAAVLVIALILAFRYTRAGLAMRAAAEDQLASQASGVRVSTVFAQTWIVSALVAAVGGILLGSLSTISLHLSEMGLKVFPVIIGGGLESILGAVICGPLVGILETLGDVYIGQYVGGYVSEVLPYIFLVLVLIIKPYGLFGLAQIRRI